MYEITFKLNVILSVFSVRAVTLLAIHLVCIYRINGYSTYKLLEIEGHLKDHFLQMDLRSKRRRYIDVENVDGAKL